MMRPAPARPLSLPPLPPLPSAAATARPVRTVSTWIPVLRCAPLLGLVALPTLAHAGLCTVPEATHPTIQRAVDDVRCTEIALKEQVYTGQVSINRPDAITIHGVGAGRTVLASPLRRTRSTQATTFLRNFTYVVQLRPGSVVTLSDVTIDGGSSARCSENYFGIRAHNARIDLEGVVIENVRGRTTDFACPNVIAAAATAEGTGASATLGVTRSSVRAFQQIGLLARGAGATLTVKNTVLRGAGTQNQQVQTGIAIRDGAGGTIDRATVNDMHYSGDPCRGVATALSITAAAATQVQDSVFSGIDRGAAISKNTIAPIQIAGSRFVETLGGILSSDNGTGRVQISGNAFVSTARSSAATVTTCFDDSGDAIAAKNEKDTVISKNSAADSARCAIELLTGSSNLDVAQNQSVRSARADIEDHGTGNRMTMNLCQSSTPSGLCSGTP